MSLLRYIGKRFTERRDITPNDTHTSLKRDLGALHLSLLGVGSTVGSGIYVIIGTLSRDVAGPAVIISFLIAGLSTYMTSLCFAQYALRIPRGSLYMYIMCTYGELAAFVVCWESMTGAGLMASVTAQGFGNYLDSFFNFTLSNISHSYTGRLPIKFNDFILEYPEILSGLTVVVCSVFISYVSVKFFGLITSILAVLNSLVLIVFSIIGFLNGDFNFWLHNDHGGFFPYGIKGLLKAASICVSAYAGFKCICMAAEETKNPTKTVPKALTISAVFTSALYILVSMAFTLLVPFWLADVKSPLTNAVIHSTSVPTFVSMFIRVGPILGMLCAMTLTLYGVSRLLFSMADNGLLWSKFTKVSQGHSVPVTSSLTVGLLVSFFATLFNITKLINAIALGAIFTMAVLSYGTLLLTSKYDDWNDKEIDVKSGPEDYRKPIILSCTNKVFRSCRYVPYNVYVCLEIIFSVMLSIFLMLMIRGNIELRARLLILSILSFICLLVTTSIISYNPYTPVTTTGIFTVLETRIFPSLSGFLNVLFFVNGCDVTSLLLFLSLNGVGVLCYLAVCILDYLRTTGKIPKDLYTRMSIEESA